jgi:DNA-binding CsgD family transcriptional regulator/tetratricopeptide (TPR) repeat protein
MDATPLFGRDRELAALRELAVGRLPAVGLVRGPAGVGKSSLVRALAARWDGVVLRGHGDPLVPRPFGVLLEAVGPLVAGWHGIPDALGRRAQDVRALLDEDEGVGQERGLAAAVALVRHLVGEGPGLLVVEDLHWADAPSLALVSRLVRAGGLPLAVVGTYRPGEGGPALARLIADLERRAGAQVTELPGLSRGDVAMLVQRLTGRRVSPRVASALHERTSGNPLFVEELAASLGGADPSRLVRQPLPRTAADAVLARVGSLDPDSGAVAEVIAALGSAVDLRLAAAVVDGDPTPALRRLADAGVVVEVSVDRFVFRHDLLREAIAARMLGRQRQELHDRAYRVLRDDGCQDHALLARHAALAGRHGDLVDHALDGAKDLLAGGFPLEALSLAEQGIAAAGSTSRLSLVAAMAARNLGFYRDAAAHAEAALEQARREGGQESQVEAHLLLAEVHGAQGDLERQHAELDRARATARDEALRARCASATARVLLLEERHEEAVAEADRALALAGSSGCVEVLAGTLVTKASALLSLPGTRDDGWALLEEGRGRALREGDTFTVSRALLNGLATRAHASEGRRAWSAFEEARSYARQHALDSIGGNIARCGADLAVREGDLVRAEALLRERLVDEVDIVEAVSIAAKAGLLACERGDDETAAVLLDQYRDDARRIEQHWVRTYLHLLAVAHAARTGGDVEAALGRYRDAVPPHGHTLRAARAAEAARWALLGGVPRAKVDRFLGGTLAGVDASAAWWGAQLDVALAEAWGDDEAVLLDRPFEQLAVPHWTADTHVRKARAALRAGRPDLGDEHARRARRLLERWPGWRRDEADAVLRALRSEVPLTAREREVLVLLTEGTTNQQIARRLGISPRTVAVHVSNILRKTGCSSRAGVAGWAFREGVV